MDDYFVIDFVFWLPDENSRPSKELDDRTRRSKKFNSEAEAKNFVKELFSYEENKGWLASVELKRVSVKLIKTFV